MRDTEHFDRLAEARYRRILSSRPAYVWRQFADGEQLKARIFFPAGHDAGCSAPSVLFFHGGMWNSANEVEFVPWALQLAEYGIVSILADYRTKRNFEVTAEDILDDAGEAWQWVYGNASVIGLDKNAISLAGSDAGGLMALHAGMAEYRTKWRWFRKRMEVEPQPAAILLFRGVADTEQPEAAKLFAGEDEVFHRKYSPSKRFRRMLPALFASHGDQDRLLPWKRSRTFARQWKKGGNRQKFLRVPKADHSYYHFNVNARRFEYVLSELMDFMNEAGIWKIEHEDGGFLLT